MSFEEQVGQLTTHNINEIETHYYAAIETEHGSGEHWILRLNILPRLQLKI